MIYYCPSVESWVVAEGTDVDTDACFGDLQLFDSVLGAPQQVWWRHVDDEEPVRADGVVATCTGVPTPRPTPAGGSARPTGPRRAPSGPLCRRRPSSSSVTRFPAQGSNVIPLSPPFAATGHQLLQQRAHAAAALKNGRRGRRPQRAGSWRSSGSRRAFDWLLRCDHLVELVAFVRRVQKDPRPLFHEST